MTPLQFAGKLSAMGKPLLPAAAMMVALNCSIAMVTADCRNDGHTPSPANGISTIFAGLSVFDSHPVMFPPTLQTMLSAASDAYPVEHLPRTRMDRSVIPGAMPPDNVPSTSVGEAARMYAILVPCQLGVGHMDGSESPSSGMSSGS
jgi:hypothetical protein